MPLFAVIGLDKPDALPLRLANREQHLAYIAAHREMVKTAGPMLDETSDMSGSLLIIEAEDLAAAQAFSASDPYTVAGLWQQTIIRPFKLAVGQL